MKKKRLILIGIIIIFFLGATFLYFRNDRTKKENQETTKTEKRNLEEEIKSKYSKYARVTKKENLYKLEEDKYVKVGTVSKNTELVLKDNQKISKNTKYFEIEGNGLFISYENVEKLDKITETNKDYKNYISFDKSVVTKTTKLYRDNKLVYEFDESMTFPIIINDDNKYVEYQDELYYIKKEDIDKTINNNNKEEYAKEMAVFTYHFFEEDNMSNCGEIICIKRRNFEAHIKYLSDNDYYTVTMNEFEMFMDKKVLLPKKSVLLTVDDGALGTDTILPEILEKYNKRATLFLITSFFPLERFTSPNVELHSHTDDMHTPGVCPGGQGGGIKCLSEEKILADLKKTRDLLNNTTAFAYPFYEYNTRAIELLKKSGFTIAFVGGNRKAVPGGDKMLVPRYAVLSTTTVNDIIKRLN